MKSLYYIMGGEAGAYALANTAKTNADNAQKDVASLATRVTTAEQKITDDSIVSTVRESVEYTNDLGEKVNSTEVISSINQTAESITIDASKINLVSAITFDSLNSDLQGTINEHSEFVSEQKTVIQQNANDITLLKEKKVDLSTIQEWARFDGAILELGVSNSEFLARLSNTELGFYQNAAKTAWLSNQELWANDVKSVQSISVSSLVLKVEEDVNNGYSFM